MTDEAVIVTIDEQLIVGTDTERLLVVVAEPPPAILVDEIVESLVVTAIEQSIVVQEVEDVHVVFAGEQGPPGVQGPAGSSSSVQYPAGEALGGHRFVVINDAGAAVYASASNVAHANKILGMTTGAVSMGDTATIHVGGEITEPSWSWVLGTPIWLADTGLMSQAPPPAGFSLIVGFPLSTTKMFVALREPIFIM